MQLIIICQLYLNNAAFRIHTRKNKFYKRKKFHWPVHLGFVHFTAHKLYLNKVLFV